MLHGRSIRQPHTSPTQDPDMKLNRLNMVWAWGASTFSFAFVFEDSVYHLLLICQHEFIGSILQVIHKGLQRQVVSTKNIGPAIDIFDVMLCVGDALWVIITFLTLISASTSEDRVKSLLKLFMFS